MWLCLSTCSVKHYDVKEKNCRALQENDGDEVCGTFLYKFYGPAHCFS